MWYDLFVLSDFFPKICKIFLTENFIDIQCPGTFKHLVDNLLGKEHLPWSVPTFHMFIIYNSIWNHADNLDPEIMRILSQESWIIWISWIEGGNCKTENNVCVFHLDPLREKLTLKVFRSIPGFMMAQVWKE